MRVIENVSPKEHKVISCNEEENINNRHVSHLIIK